MSESKRSETGEVADTSAADAYPVFRECIPQDPIRSGRYTVGFARTREELETLQRLRFDVFNVELGEGLEQSYATGRDEDEFDPVCHHLIVREAEGNRILGTYRMQTGAMAERFRGFYSAEEFDLGSLPHEVLHGAIEVGRACVAKEFRNRHVLFLLWKGLAAYLQHNRKHRLFGCCSLTSQDPAEGKRVMDHLEATGHVHPRLRVRPRPDWLCYEAGFDPGRAPAQEVRLPKLFSLYLRYGAKVLGPPALDRHFKTIDYFVLLDTDELGREARETFFR